MADTLMTLVKKLHDSIDEVDRKAREAVKDSSQEVQQGWRRRVKDRQHTPTSIPRLPKAIGWNMNKTPQLSHEGEIGYNMERKAQQASFGHFLEFGVPSQNTAPGLEGARALAAETPRFHQRMRDIADGVL